MAEELEDKYSRFKRNTGIDLQAEVAGGGDLEDYYTKIETNNLLNGKTNTTDTEALDARVTSLEESSPSVDLSDTPRFLRFNDGWPARGNSNRATFFIGGDPNSDAPTDLNLAAGDLWIPFGGGVV